MRLLLALTLCLSLLFAPFIHVFAQDEDRAVIRDNISKQDYSLYPDAAAIILYEKGVVEITSRYEQLYRVHRIVKLLKQSAFDEADVREFYQNDDRIKSFSEKIIGTTYNLENGKTVKTPLNKSAIFRQRINDVFDEMKFTLPAVKEGSIIEYSYEIRSSVHIVPPDWNFQNEYPTLKSEFELICPPTLQYVYVTQATPNFRQYKLLKDCEADSVQTYQVFSQTIDNGSDIVWGRKNLRPVISEPYISSDRNHIERIDIQLAASNTSGDFLSTYKYMNTWERFNETILPKYSKYWEGRNSVLNGIVDEAKKQGDKLFQARYLFNYIRSGYYCSDSISDYPETSLEKIIANKSGNAAELNLLLVSLLKKSNITASPVVLSTLGNLKADPIYPLVNRFNHLVCMAIIDDKKYFLDASSRNNAFGLLPLYCYNGYARVVDKAGEGIMLLPEQVKEKSVNTVQIDSISSRGFVVNLSSYMGMYQSRALRNEVKGNIEKLKEKLSDHYETEGQKVEAISILNFDNPDTNLVVKYHIVKKFETPVSKLFLSIDYIKNLEANPFVSMERYLPVEFNSQLDEVYILQVKLPENVEPEELPKPSMISLEGNKMQFRHLLGYDSTMRVLSVNSKFQINETVFPVETYDTIRKFFEKMIMERNHIVVLNIKS